MALTKDEKLVLAHDETFSRLALNPTSQSSQMKVGDLTLKEIISLTFKSGSRPPLLIDVLTSARALEANCKLVIEIKPGNIEASTALVRLFRHHPDLIDSCAVVMSFDAFIMHRLKCELNDLGSSLGYDSNMLPQVLLLTVADQPQAHYELWLNILDPSPVHSWLQHGNKPSLDGGKPLWFFIFICTTHLLLYNNLWPFHLMHSLPSISAGNVRADWHAIAKRAEVSELGDEAI